MCLCVLEHGGCQDLFSPISNFLEPLTANKTYSDILQFSTDHFVTECGFEQGMLIVLIHFNFRLTLVKSSAVLQNLHK